jgi:alcohol dehydrogenase class IV
VPSFEFASAGRIVFGRGCSDRVPGLCKELGATRVLVVTGATPTRASPLLAALRSAGLHADVFAAPGGGEPTLDTAAAGVAAGRALAADCVVGFGGGSALDLAKAVLAAVGSDKRIDLDETFTPAAVRVRRSSCARLREAFELGPFTELAQGLPATVAWSRDALSA